MTERERRRRKMKFQKIRIMIYNILILALFIIIAVLVMQKIVPLTKVTIDQIVVKDPYEISYKEKAIAEFDTIKASSLNTYGETINIGFKDDQKQNQLTLVNTKYKEDSTSFKLSDKADIGISANQIPVGSFFLRTTNNKFVKYPMSEPITFNTITRNGMTNPITIDSYEGLLHIKKEEAVEDNDELDILVDAGHGGTDIGSTSLDGSVTEADINLQVAKIVANDLKADGYKVGLSRKDDSQPGECDSNYNAYCKGGRVTQAYDKKAKLTVSIHHNTGGGNGYEVYSSYYSSHKLASMVARNLSKVGHASSRQDGYIKPGVYTQTYTDGGTVQDYMYMVREVGGLATHSKTPDNKPQNESPEGSEGILIELGYLDNADDLAHVTDPKIQKREAKAISDAVDSYIKQEASNTITTETESEK